MKRKATLLAALYLLSGVAGSLAAAQTVPVDIAPINPDASVAGNYTASIHMTMAAHQYDTTQNEKIVKEEWTFKQDGGKLSGTEKTEKSELPFKGTIEGNSIHGVVMDGDQHYTISLTVDPSDGTMTGSIRMGIHEYLLMMAKAK